MDSLVTTEWLANEMGASDLRIVDATKHLAEAGRDGRAEYLAAQAEAQFMVDEAEIVAGVKKVLARYSR